MLPQGRKDTPITLFQRIAGQADSETICNCYHWLKTLFNLLLLICKEIAVLSGTVPFWATERLKGSEFNTSLRRRTFNSIGTVTFI